MQGPPPGYQQPYQPYQPGYPPNFQPPKRRNGLLIALIAGFLVLAAVTAFAVIRLTSGGDDSPAQPAPATNQPTRDQTPSTEPSQTPSETPSGPRTASADTVTAAFEKAGFACYLATRDPVTVHRCYLEPLLDGQDGIFNEQRITMQSTGTGVKSLEVLVRVSEQPAAVTPVYTKAVQALTGSLLPAADVRTILAASPAARQLRLTWGTAKQSVNSRRDLHSLTVVANGERTVPIGFSKTKVSYDALMAAYAKQGYRCYTKFSIRRCETTRAGVFFHVHASDPCQNAGPELAKACKGAPVFSVSMTVGFGTVTDDLLRSILEEFHAVAALTAGGPVPEANAWMDARLTGKAFMADYGGLQYSILPGTGNSGGRKNAVTLSIEGFNPA